MLAERCRIGRDYGNPGDYDCRFVGLNARMSELHAATALNSLTEIDERIRGRNVVAESYLKALAEVPGISFPTVPEGDRSTFKDFTVLVDAATFGADAGALATALAAEGVDTRRYYFPPVHAMRAYRRLAGPNGSLAVTEAASAQALSLPLWADMRSEQVLRVAEAIRRIRAWT